MATMATNTNSKGIEWCSESIIWVWPNSVGHLLWEQDHEGSNPFTQTNLLMEVLYG